MPMLKIIGVVDSTIVEAAATSLRALSSALRTASDYGELDAEARLAWLYAMLFRSGLPNPEDLARIVFFANDLNERVLNWSECVRPIPGHRLSEDDERFEHEIREPSVKASREALAAVLAVVDAYRDTMPEELQ